MCRPIVFVALLAALPAAAQEAGSQIRATPQVPTPINPASAEASAAPTTRTIKCERLQADQRERCLRTLNEPDIGKKPVGAGSTGMGSGAGGNASGPGGSMGSGATPR